MEIIRLLEWYFGFRPLVRFILAVLVLGLGLSGMSNWHQYKDGRAGIVAAVGLILVLASFTTAGEKNEWGDW